MEEVGTRKKLTAILTELEESTSQAEKEYKSKSRITNLIWGVVTVLNSVNLTRVVLTQQWDSLLTAFIILLLGLTFWMSSVSANTTDRSEKLTGAVIKAQDTHITILTDMLEVAANNMKEAGNYIKKLKEGK